MTGVKYSSFDECLVGHFGVDITIRCQPLSHCLSCNRIAEKPGLLILAGRMKVRQTRFKLRAATRHIAVVGDGNAIDMVVCRAGGNGAAVVARNRTATKVTNACNRDLADLKVTRAHLDDLASVRCSVAKPDNIFFISMLLVVDVQGDKASDQGCAGVAAAVAPGGA